VVKPDTRIAKEENSVCVGDLLTNAGWAGDTVTTTMQRMQHDDAFGCMSVFLTVRLLVML